MAGVGLVRRAGEAAIVAALLLTALPSPVAAESAASVLTEDAHSALTADLDGDGAKEIVAIVSLPETGKQPARRRLGRARRQVGLARRGAGRPLGGRRCRGAHRPAGRGHGRAPVAQDGDRVRVVVAVGTPYTDTNPGACCLSFADVRLQGQRTSISSWCRRSWDRSRAWPCSTWRVMVATRLL